MMDQKPSFKSEAEFIAWIRRQTRRRADGLTLGIGDDAALLAAPRGRELILTTDLSIEGVHFNPTLHPARSVGHRALARSLSDIAAMGGTPRYVLLSLALSRRTERRWLEEFFTGLFALARRFAVVIIGGDTAVVEGPTAIDVVVVGEVPSGQALRRSGARPGDRIFVSGRLGLAAWGLGLLSSRRVNKATEKEKMAIRAHLYPQPQCALGRFLSKYHWASSLMDLSDGLSLDLRRLCDASAVGARLYADQIPTPPIPDVQQALRLALDGGEDYQLLFTVPQAKASKLPRRFGRIPLCWIGEIHASPRLDIATADGKIRTVEIRGYDHFSRLSHLSY